MDILTSKGQKSLEYERQMLDMIRKHICKKHKDNSYLIETDKDMDAKVDGMIVKQGQLAGVFEVDGVWFMACDS